MAFFNSIVFIWPCDSLLGIILSLRYPSISYLSMPCKLWLLFRGFSWDFLEFFEFCIFFLVLLAINFSFPFKYFDFISWLLGAWIDLLYLDTVRSQNIYFFLFKRWFKFLVLLPLDFLELKLSRVTKSVLFLRCPMVDFSFSGEWAERMEWLSLETSVNMFSLSNLIPFLLIFLWWINFFGLEV